ncbi:hypothetical protein ACIPY2_19705 [Paenarthrobacter sp. NPDC089675]|uniref:hypothetical protein n=1 Tax=Paenarthrobacter sp. NPDC089675 TaxID=3364376 RepID=UPI0038221296
MTDPAPRPGTNRPRRGPGWLRFLAVLFTAAAAASLLLVAIDVIVGRPAAGDLFISGLNALAAVVLWRVGLKRAGA